MPRYIDANQIRYCWMYDADGTEHDGVTLQSIIDKVPTADVVEVSKVIEIIREVQQYSLVSEDVVRKILELGKSQKEEVNSNA